jgi:circadian clock protein KaiC
MASAFHIPTESPPVAPTGIVGLDSILHGGLPREEMHLIQGVAGTGKTTIALHFLREAVRSGESALYLTLSQSKEHLERIAHSHGWSVEGITIHELSPGTVASRIAARQTILPTADVELGELFRELSDLIERVQPRRAVIDSITVLQMLAGNPQRYHREVVTLRQMFVEQRCTLLALADHPAEIQEGDPPEVIFHPLSGCVIHLQQQARAFGDARRGLRVVKTRGIPSNGGYHDLKIRTGILEVYPRLGAYDMPERSNYQRIATGVEVLDQLVGGGIETGTSCLIVGQSGVGKSTISNLYATAVAASGSHAAIFLFDERPEASLVRADGLGIPLREHVNAGRILLRQLDPGEISPGEFAQHVRKLVEDRNTKVVVIDSVIGYFAAMGAVDLLVTQLHELLTYLTRNDVLLIMCGSQEGFMSIGTQDAVDVSYLSDTIIVLTFFETAGTLRRALTVVKKKFGVHALTIHELRMDEGRVEVGHETLNQFRNIMVPATTNIGEPIRDGGTR